MTTVTGMNCRNVNANSFLRLSNRKQGRYFIVILQRTLLCWCAWLSLLAAAAAQTAPVASSQGKQESHSNFEGKIGAVPESSAEYSGISAEGRLHWFVRSTAGPRSLAGGILSSGLGTAIDSPSEYGPHWEGFAERYGMRMTGISTGNAIDVVLGAAWGEDPRYFYTVHRPFGSRVKNIVESLFPRLLSRRRAPPGLCAIRGHLRQQFSFEPLAGSKRSRLATRPDPNSGRLRKPGALQYLQGVCAAGLEKDPPQARSRSIRCA